LSVNQIVGGVLVLSGIYIWNQTKNKWRQDQRSENQVPRIKMNPKEPLQLTIVGVDAGK